MSEDFDKYENLDEGKGYWEKFVGFFFIGVLISIIAGVVLFTGDKIFINEIVIGVILVFPILFGFLAMIIPDFSNGGECDEYSGLRYRSQHGSHRDRMRAGQQLRDQKAMDDLFNSK